jgi:biotin carboxyl carrier protein
VADPEVIAGLSRFAAVLGVAAVFAVPVAVSPSAFTDETRPEDSVRSLMPPPIGARHEAVDAARTLEAASVDEARTEAPVFARFEEVELTLPAETVHLVGYHEAWHSNALPMSPVGSLIENLNATRFDAPDDVEGPDYLVMASRGRAADATSAVDIAMDAGEAVYSPVDGTVTAVLEYQLYGRHEDVRIEIAPDVRPDLRVVVIHVDDVEVRPGDVVAAGETVLAGTSVQLPFASHIDRHVDGAEGPHVHVEVKEFEPPGTDPEGAEAATEQEPGADLREETGADTGAGTRAGTRTGTRTGTRAGSEQGAP